MTELTDSASPAEERPLTLREAVRHALNELGVPGEGYPSPVANAVDILSAALASVTDDERPGLLARWPEADLFAALDAEGWFRGMDTKDAAEATAKVYARLAASVTDDERLDPERLARAMASVDTESDPTDADRALARLYVAEYERLRR